MKTVKTINNSYEIIFWKRRDSKFNVYVQKTSNLSGTYCGECLHQIGTINPTVPSIKEIKKMKFEIY